MNIIPKIFLIEQGETGLFLMILLLPAGLPSIGAKIWSGVMCRPDSVIFKATILIIYCSCSYEDNLRATRPSAEQVILILLIIHLHAYRTHHIIDDFFQSGRRVDMIYRKSFYFEYA